MSCNGKDLEVAVVLCGYAQLPMYPSARMYHQNSLTGISNRSIGIFEMYVEMQDVLIWE